MNRICLAVLVAALVPATASAIGVGVGAFAGTSTPVLYESANGGYQVGFRAPLALAPLLVVEPFYAQAALGDVDEFFGGEPYTRSGPDVKTFGANAMFTFGEGVKFYPIVGLGATTIEQAGAEDITDTSLNFGLGIGFSPITKIMFDIRGEFCSVITGDTSRKMANFNLGVSYAIFE